MQQYVPLHLHTEYSLLDGATKIQDLITHCKENNMPAAAITDHGVMYGAIDFYRKAKEQGLKPIIGCEFYIINGDIKEKKVENKKNFHLVLIAKNKIGYMNLVKLVSIAQVDGFYYKPRINHELLEQYKEGLICMSACLAGELCQYLLKDEKEKAFETAKYYKDLFGDDYYIEIQDHNIPEQKRTNPDLINIARELDIDLVITNDSHYTKKEDAKAHDILLCLQTGKLKSDPGRMRFPGDEFYIKNADDLRKSFDWLDEATFNTAIENTVKVADKCNLIIELGKSALPNYDIPPNHTNESYLNKVAREGLEKKYKEITPELEKRFNYELGIIEKMGFAAYFLIVADFMRYSVDNDIPIGPGRGSAAGSLIAYILDITQLDPIEHNLLFERFLNPERVSMPDVDIDFCIEKRGQVIEYVTNKYGTDRVCQIITFGTFAAKAAMKGVARVLDIPYAESDRLAKMIPTQPGIKIDDALKDGMDLKKEYDDHPHVKELVDIAKSIEGIKNNIGMHAAGVIISRDPLSDVVPVQSSKEGIIITQYPMADVEMLGLLKMDFLGLRNLTIIDKTCKLVKKRHNIDLDMNHINLDDEKVYELLTNGDTDGVFQLESQGMKQLVKALKPSVFDDLGALVALYRPGPLNSGMVKNFVERKHGRQKIDYPHPCLEEILKDTYGTIVYQEQIMKIAQVMAGYTLGQADILRRAMGHKKIDVMKKQKAIFLDGSEKNGVDRKIADDLFETMMEFAAYCFNRSHSAAYAFVAYQTAYLKAHYAIEYMSALLSSVGNNQDKVQLYISECQKMGIEVLPPEINSSDADFTPDNGNIRFGLASIKNVGAGIVDDIVEERQTKPFTSFHDFLSRIDAKSLNKRTLESLSKSGAFVLIEKSRKQVFENIESAVSSVTEQNKSKASGQVSLFAGLSDEETESFSFSMKGSEDEFKDAEIQSFEKEYLGFYVTSHPLSSIKAHLPFLTTHKISDLKHIPENTYVTICGLITNCRQLTTKKNKLLKVGALEDLTGKVDFVAFSETLQKYNSYLEPEKKVVLGGKIQFRGDEDITVSLMINSVNIVENCNLVNVHIKDGTSFEDIVAAKDFIAKNKGSDPVILNLENGGKLIKAVTSSFFWTQATSELINGINKHFAPNIQITVKSLDED